MTFALAVPPGTQRDAENAPCGAGGQRNHRTERAWCPVVSVPPAAASALQVEGPEMDRLKKTHFLAELTGKVRLSHFAAVSSVKPELTRATLEAARVSP